MSGWKEWEFLERVTSSEFQSYLQDQVVQVYASTAARSSALGTAVSEGMISYLEDTNAIQFYDGTTWTNVSNPGDITGVTAGTGLTGGGDSGAVTLNVNYAAVGSAVLASPNITGTATIAAGSVTGNLVVGGDLSDPNWTGARVLTTSGSTAVTSTVTTTELGHLSGVTSSIQTQLNNRLPLTGGVIDNGANSSLSIHGSGASAIEMSSTFNILDFKNSNAEDFDVRISHGSGSSGVQIEAAAGMTLGKTLRNITLSTTTPSGGADGDVWLQYTP